MDGWLVGYLSDCCGHFGGFFSFFLVDEQEDEKGGSDAPSINPSNSNIANINQLTPDISKQPAS